jgi:hypothetical protein
VGQTIEATPLSAPLDDYLREVVQTLHTAVNQGMRHPSADAEIADCREILRVIMAGDVETWLD